MNKCGVWQELWKGWEQKWMEIFCWKLQCVSTVMNINIAYAWELYTYANIQIDISMIFVTMSTLQMTTELKLIIYYLKEDYCAHHSDWKMERLDGLAQIQGLWHNQIYDLIPSDFVLVFIKNVLLSLVTEGICGISQKSADAATGTTRTTYFLVLFSLFRYSYGFRNFL